MNNDRHSAGDTHGSVFGTPHVFSFQSFGQAVKASVKKEAWSGLRGELHRFLRAGIRKHVNSIHTHNEAVFRFLVANENRRSERSGRSSHVLLVYLAGPEGYVARMDGEMMRTVLPAISGVLRETDYIGWYRDDHVVGGVLTALDDHSTGEAFNRIEQRLFEGLGRSLPEGDLTRLRLRFFRSQEFDGVDSADHVVTLG